MVRIVNAVNLDRLGATIVVAVMVAFGFTNGFHPEPQNTPTIAVSSFSYSGSAGDTVSAPVL